MKTSKKGGPMNFKKSYEKVKWIVWKCEKEFYIHLWDHADWEQEGRLVLYELQISNPEVEENEEILLTYFKTKVRNHIKDKVRKQDSDKRKLNKVPYTEIGEISHRLRSKELFLDELVLLRGALKEFREKLTDQEKEEYDKLLMNRRFSGKAKMRRRLQEYLKDFKDHHL